MAENYFWTICTTFTNISFKLKYTTRINLKKEIAFWIWIFVNLFLSFMLWLLVTWQPRPGLSFISLLMTEYPRIFCAILHNNHPIHPLFYYFFFLYSLRFAFNTSTVIYSCLVHVQHLALRPYTLSPILGQTNLIRALSALREPLKGKARGKNRRKPMVLLHVSQRKLYYHMSPKGIPPSWHVRDPPHYDQYSRPTVHSFLKTNWRNRAAYSFHASTLLANPTFS